MATKSPLAVIFTDGACIGNPGPGGYAALIKLAGGEHEIVGGDPKTTNNKMEMMAAIKALEAIPLYQFSLIRTAEPIHACRWT